MDRFRLMFAGSLSPSQDLGVIVDWAERTGSELHIVGSVSEDFYWDNLERVHFHGHLSQAEVQELLHNSHVMLHPMPLMGYPAIGAKLSDYLPFLALGKRLLILEYQDNRDLQELASKNGNVKVLRYDDVDGINEWLNAVYGFMMEF